jgi:phenylalanine-4-hydroxylase
VVSDRQESELQSGAVHSNRAIAVDLRDLVCLNPEHPGFHDSLYRERRHTIARIAERYRQGSVVPTAPYTEDEHGVWRSVQQTLAPLHRRLVCSELVELAESFPLDPFRIPQLVDLNPRLEAATGFRMEPIGGLVEARHFLSALGKQVFLSTQYIRHSSRPLYTPEPDIVHELIGHAATLAHPRIAKVNQAFGLAADLADDEEARRLESVYWYTMEFGVVEEAGRPRAFGAGLLSSGGELAQLETGPQLLPWDLDRVATTAYDPTQMQPALFVAPGFHPMLADLVIWLESGGWRTPR